jgi:Major Facilitator Superfamily
LITTSPAGAEASVPVILSKPARQKIFAYLGVLILLLAFGAPAGGLIDIPISFLLKNRLHLQASELANFRLAAALPLYLSFVFGFVRDSWSPFGMGDRGFLCLFGSLSSVLYIFFAFTPVSYVTLLFAIVLLTVVFLFASSAQNGMTAAIGQRHLMTGQVSAMWNIFLSVPTVAALLVGGWLSGILEERDPDEAIRILFLAGAVVMASVSFYALWRPKFIFDGFRSEQSGHPLKDFQRLFRHGPIYPALAIWLLWSFAPGSATPLQYYLQNTLGAADAQWGQWNAIFAVSFIPAFLVFNFLCQRVSLRILLFWGTAIAIPQMVPLLLIKTVTDALIAAVPIGLMGGLATAAYIDLIIRSSPPGLQGTVLMMSSGLYFIAVRFGDVLGTNLYSFHGGFPTCVIAITAVYALILPMLWLVPKKLVATTDGQVGPQPAA